MRLGIGIIVLAVALGTVGWRMYGAIGNEVSTETKMGAGVGVTLLIFVVGVWLRIRWRRR